MKWITHQVVAVGAAFCMGMEGPALAGVFLGAILPDVLDQRLAGLARDRQKAFNQIHRGTTHWFGWWLGLWFLASLPVIPPLIRPVLAGVGFGALLHVTLDMCTVSGVPLVPWSRSNKISLKMCSTGSVGEYAFLAATAILFALLNREPVMAAVRWLGDTTLRL